MAEQHQWAFYEVMWRIEGRGRRMPLPWWVRQYFRRWVAQYDEGLFPSREAAFASNAHYRYWHMVGVKDHHQECLIGQAGEIEPVYDEYAVSFFLFEPTTGALHFPQFSGALTQHWERGYLPVLVTTYQSPLGVEVQQRVMATTVGRDQKSLVLARVQVKPTVTPPVPAWLGVSVCPAGPTGFWRQDRAREHLSDRRLTYVRYLPGEQRFEVNASLGPVCDSPPQHYGTYGNGDSTDPDFYLTFNAYEDLRSRGRLNGFDTAVDYMAGLCHAALLWELNWASGDGVFRLDIRLPVDDFRGPGDLAELRAADAGSLERSHLAFWAKKLDQSGLQLSLPPLVQHLADLYRVCRSTLLVLADAGEIHPGPTIYDSFWIRDSSVEGIACALAGDHNLPQRQFAEHFTRPGIFHLETRRVGPASLHGFFGGQHEQQDLEWDSNGQALWAFGRFDRISGGRTFGARVFSPYVVEGARWLRDNRSAYGLLHSGWSAEHLGDKDKPHYWDDFWGIAGLWEAARLAERLGAPQAGEIWAIYDDLRRSTADSIRWVLAEQRRRGHWETFIPTGPADVGRLDSTMIGTVAYFHPCRLYMGAKLGDDIDRAARQTLDTIWRHFMDGGFRHDSAWYCYGPYLTLQLAHAFLLTGDVDRMDRCLGWSVHAANARLAEGGPGAPVQQVALGAWNEQHCYPVATEFQEVPERWWYMGDIPHGWAAAELMLLVRDMLFFEADEDGGAHIYLAPGIPPHWLAGGQSVGVSDAPTVFGTLFGYELAHDEANGAVKITIRQPPPPHVRYVYPCRLGAGVRSAFADGIGVPVTGRDVHLPAGATQFLIHCA